MSFQNFCEAPNFVKGVIERRWGGPDDVRLAKIALHTRGLQFAEQILSDARAPGSTIVNPGIRLHEELR